jgi:arylsulfatase A-like enzyme
LARAQPGKRSRRRPSRRRHAGTGTGLLLVAAALLGACTRAAQPPPAGPPRHLILISVDTLRGDHTSLLGYPRETTPVLDRWADSGVVFERAIAQWPKTGTSFASLFSGRYPQSTGLTHKAALRVPATLEFLPAVLQESGFRTVGVVSNAVLSKELGWDRGFDEYHESWGDELTEDPVEYRKLLWAGRVNELALPLLERHRTAERLFAWIHYSDPHAPYVLPAGRENPFLEDELYAREPDERVDLRGTRGKAIGDRRELAFYRAQYDANVLVTDEAIGELLERLDSTGLLADAIVVITADHGESLGEHGSYFEHGPLPYNTASQVPLLVLAPGRIEARRVAEPVALVDLFPTLLEWLLPERQVAGAEGASLLAVLRGEAPVPARGGDVPVALAEAGRPPTRYWSAQDRRWKLVFQQPPAGRPASIADYELYDLATDPLETNNLAADHPELARLRRHLEAWRKSAQQSAPEREQSESEIKALRALGYVDEAPGGAPPDDGSVGGEPDG